MWDKIKTAIETAQKRNVSVVVWSLPRDHDNHMHCDMLVIYASVPWGMKLRVMQKTFTYDELEQMHDCAAIVADTINQITDTLLLRPQRRVMVEMFSAPYYTLPGHP